MTTEVFWPELIPVRESLPRARVNTFWVGKASGNPYAVKEMFKPISVSNAISYIEDPGIGKTSYGERNNDIMQNTVPFNPVLERGPIAQDIPDGLYEWVRFGEVTLDNVDERILEFRQRGGERFLTPIRKYLQEVKSIGDETEISNNGFIIELTSLKTEFHIEGEKNPDGSELFRSTMSLAGQFNEVRQGPDGDNIIRIRKKAGRPTAYDAINLAINNFAYKAEHAANDQEIPEPGFMVLNLVDGKMYTLEIFSGRFYREIGNALFFSYLARRAGNVPDEMEGITEVDLESAKSHEKKVEIKRGKKKKMTLTAGEVFHKAESCVARLTGKLPHTNPQFRFVELSREEWDYLEG